MINSQWQIFNSDPALGLRLCRVASLDLCALALRPFFGCGLRTFQFIDNPANSAGCRCALRGLSTTILLISFWVITVRLPFQRKGARRRGRKVLGFPEREISHFAESRGGRGGKTLFSSASACSATPREYTRSEGFHETGMLPRLPPTATVIEPRILDVAYDRRSTPRQS
jgi:hypothetical protein